ncbi:hypothetical protein [Roseateles terrae]|uniref:CheW-like domain-containing protein n=1 Tax=Roseateles terrae TaxID=431060 RepID=A0ABR6GKK1_9BURK|nr:hypothetical protein [Roseateles terrae]MBB3192638.1 hypothetical protein [Roseateles terrae]
MDDEKFWAEVEVDQTEEGLWQPVLVVGKGEGHMLVLLDELRGMQA